MIKKIKNQYQVLSHDGSKKLGTYNTRKEAEARLKQVEVFKHIKKILKKPSK